MLEDKYEKIINYLYSEYNLTNVLHFNEDVVNEIVKLKTKRFYENFTDYDWKRIIDLYEHTQSAPLLRAICCCPALPENYFLKLFNAWNWTWDTFPLISDKVPDEIIEKLLTTLSPVTLIDYFNRCGENLSAVALEKLCEKLDKKDMWQIDYLPYQYVCSYGKIAIQIIDMINNPEKYFSKADPPELFLTAVINNKRLDDDIRNLAFDKGFVPEKVTNYTEYIIKEMYFLYANTIFDITDNRTEHSDTIKIAENKLQELIISNKLPESLQIDLVNRFIHKNKYIKENNLLLTLISHTHFPELLKYVIQKSSDVNLHSAVMENVKYLTNEVFDELLKKYDAKELQIIFLNTIAHNEINTKTQIDFLNINNRYVNMGMMLSNKIDVDGLIIRNAEYTEDSNMLEFIHSLKTSVNFLPYNSDKILAFAGMKLLEKDYEKKPVVLPTRTALKKLLESQYPSKWLAINKADYNYLKEEFDWLKTKFPDFAYIVGALKEKLEDVYKKSEIINKYKNNIFFTDINEEIKEKHPSYSYTDADSYIGCEFIDMDALFRLSSKDMNAFIKDVKEMGDIELWLDLKSSISKYIKDTRHSDIMFLKIHRLVNLFNAVNEKVEEYNIEHQNKSPKIEEIFAL